MQNGLKYKNKPDNGLSGCDAMSMRCIAMQDALTEELVRSDLSSVIKGDLASRTTWTLIWIFLLIAGCLVALIVYAVKKDIEPLVKLVIFISSFSLACWLPGFIFYTVRSKSRTDFEQDFYLVKTTVKAAEYIKKYDHSPDSAEFCSEYWEYRTGIGKFTSDKKETRFFCGQQLIFVFLRSIKKPMILYYYAKEQDA